MTTLRCLTCGATVGGPVWAETSRLAKNHRRRCAPVEKVGEMEVKSDGWVAIP